MSIDPQATTILDALAKNTSDLRTLLSGPVTPPPPSSNTILVKAGQSLPAIAAGAPDGAVFQLMNGVVYLGRLAMTKRQTVVSLNPIPPGRAVPSAAMPRIHGGIDILPGAEATFGGGIAVSCIGAQETLVVDRAAKTQLRQLSIVGTASGQHRGIEANGQGGNYRDCHVDDVWVVGQDSQALCGWDGTLDLIVDNCYLGAAGQSVMFGGDDSSTLARMPRNIMMTNNILGKNPIWWTQKGAQVKTSLELKAVSGFTFRKNRMLYSGIHEGHHGVAIVLTPRNQKGGAPWSTVEHVLIEDNDAAFHTGLLHISGTDDLAASGRLNDVTIRNLRGSNIDGWRYPGSGRLIQIAHGPDKLTIDTITFPIAPVNLNQVAYFSDEPPTQMQISNIASPKSVYGWFVDAQGTGLAVVKRYAPDAIFTNIIE